MISASRALSRKAALATGHNVRDTLAGAWIASQLRSLGHAPGRPILFDCDQKFGTAMAIASDILESPLVAHTHNLEPHYAIFRDKQDPLARFSRELGKELRWLAKCRAIWSIGLLEHQLFSLCKLPSRLLPYFPAPERLAQLQAVFDRRLPRADQDTVLLMGTAGNEPTLEGMREQIAFLSLQRSALRFVVVGSGTERLQSIAAPNIQVLGAVGWDELVSLFIRTRALWVHQAPMTGALTRIQETLLLGIPVVANEWGSIGMRPSPGLYTYSDISLALDMISEVSDRFERPGPPSEQEEYIFSLRDAYQ
jgi:hypothetical protein